MLTGKLGNPMMDRLAVKVSYGGVRYTDSRTEAQGTERMMSGYNMRMYSIESEIERKHSSAEPEE